ncbi:ABC transporter substrate-binding protein [Bogoriella caseilytica]|uniref:Peptide/nickel transport system substrate-binding protein n=1 Tax=Bogoriella caseilytica TaxID=56055 RepID=A0A3N2BF56_9MICO|nr:ABC transporter substrate-binding protein [Bogoriella caseilytica]ROR73882.1 peptide/nickel transport system substrate-binding protein [Bogoriella caseilytica]
MRKMRMTRYAAGLAAGALVLAACGNGTDDGAGNDTGTGSDTDNGSEGDDAAAEVEPLTVHANDGTSYQANYNPYSTSALRGTTGLIYEPLVISTPMQPGQPIPWLAESLDFNDDGTVLTVNLREGVQWSDGEAFTADDVAFTFNQLSENSALDTAALRPASATAVDETTAEIEFEEPRFAREGAIGNTVIVPEHIWSELDEPLEFVNDEDPVGTGPFVLGQFGEQMYTLVKNEEYWAADEIEVEEIRYPANTTETLTTRLQQGDLDWSGGFIANIEQVFVSHDPDNRGYWYPGGGAVNITINNEREIWDDQDLREAVSLAIDRVEVSEVAMQGYVPPAHPTGLPMPAYEEVLADEYRDMELDFDPARANEILDEAGYETGEDGVRTAPNGDRLTFDFEVPSGWPDWVDISNVIEPMFSEIGIELSPQGVSLEQYVENRNNGNFDITLASVGMGLTPYDMYRNMLSSEYRPDEDSEDQSVSANFGRFWSDEADEQLQRFENTGDDDERQEAIEEMQRFVVEERAVIPLIPTANWFQYNTVRWTGFPNEDNPYALGAPFQVPDNALIIRELTPNN